MRHHELHTLQRSIWREAWPLGGIAQRRSRSGRAPTRSPVGDCGSRNGHPHRPTRQLDDYAGSVTKTKERLGRRQVMAELKANGSAQARKTYRNAGVRGDLFGVSYTFLKKLHKRVKVDHEMALALWETAVVDARIFACWVADADKTTVKLLETWAKDNSEPSLSGELAAFAQDTNLAAGRMRKWIDMKSTYRKTLGWSIAGRLVMQLERGPDEGGVDEGDAHPARSQHSLAPFGPCPGFWGP